MRKLNSQDFALLSDHVYGKKGKDGKVELIFDNPSNREITLNGIKYKIEEIKDNPQNGYFGAVYRRMDTNEIIVVHRGTEFGTRQDREADMRMVRDHTNPQYNDAKALTEAAERWKKSQAPNATIYQTGHSLGGSLAQLCGHRYGHYTETFNAFGTAGLKEAQPLNPTALDNIINHRMGGDYVASASNHLGRSILYTTPREVSNLRKGGFATHDTKDDSFYANAFGMPERWNKPLSAFDLYTSHAMSNFTHAGGLSVLSPRSDARRLAQENMAVIERFNNHVKESVRQSPEKFEKLLDWADRHIAENSRQPNPYEWQNPVQYARNVDTDRPFHSAGEPAQRLQTAQAPLLTMADMPKQVRDMCNQCRTLLVEFDKEEGVTRSSSDYDAISLSMATKAHAAGLPEVKFIHVQGDGRINIGYESPQGMYKDTSIHTNQALALSLEDNVLQAKQTERDFALAEEQRAREAEYRAHSYGGRSYG
ncbi:Mbeg1-like protein [Neisseria sp. CCUG12390]|uniref:Mbeg1-like protein n=1 Tax=Neisseria sp. CCUG12390 TaxID=3392035 RepID=UPI003A0FCD48